MLHAQRKGLGEATVFDLYVACDNDHGITLGFPNSQPIGQPLAVEGASIYERLGLGVTRWIGTEGFAASSDDWTQAPCQSSRELRRATLDAPF